MSVTDSYTQSQTRLHNSVTELNVATAHGSAALRMRMRMRTLLR